MADPSMGEGGITPPNLHAYTTWGWGHPAQHVCLDHVGAGSPRPYVWTSDRSGLGDPTRTYEVYSYRSGLISSESMLLASYQKKPVSMTLGSSSPLIAFTAASTHL